jgi:hypothetical protein
MDHPNHREKASMLAEELRILISCNDPLPDDAAWQRLQLSLKRNQTLVSWALDTLAEAP